MKSWLGADHNSEFLPSPHPWSSSPYSASFFGLLLSMRARSLGRLGLRAWPYLRAASFLGD